MNARGHGTGWQVGPDGVLVYGCLNYWLRWVLRGGYRDWKASGGAPLWPATGTDGAVGE